MYLANKPTSYVPMGVSLCSRGFHDVRLPAIAIASMGLSMSYDKDCYDAYENRSTSATVSCVT